MVELAPGDPSAPSLSLAAGLALAEVADAVAPNVPTMLKWPNDLLIAGGKLAGVLLERSADRIVVGFGVNLAVAPRIPGRRSASIDGTITPQAFAPLLAGSFARMLALWRRSEPAAFARAWLARAHPVGTPLTVHTGQEQTVSGTFDGIDSDGALRLRRNQDVEVIRAGDVEL